MIPKRAMTATVEISTGTMIITNRPPAFTGEADALTVSITLMDGGAAYEPVGNVRAQMYLYWPGTIDMSEAVDLTLTGGVLTGALPDTLTAKSGCPLLVLQLTDIDSGSLIVAAASPIQITNVLGERVISSRPATPSEVIYIGRSPYIDTATGHWMQWDTTTSAYIDTQVEAYGRPATFTATATTLAAGSAATAAISGTPDAPILTLGIPRGDTGAKGDKGDKGDQGETGPQGPVGPSGGVNSVNGETGAVTLTGSDIATSDADTTTIAAALSSQSQQIANVTSVTSKVFQDGIEVTLPNVSSTNLTFAVSGITADHTLVQDGYAYLSNPGAVSGNLTLTTSAGKITVSGTFTGTTDIKASFVVKKQTATGTAAS